MGRNKLLGSLGFNGNIEKSLPLTNNRLSTNYSKLDLHSMMIADKSIIPK